MLLLRRTVRFSVNPPPLDGAPEGPNGFAGSPPMRGLGRYYEIVVACRGEPDPVTAYVIDIKDIDRAVRTAAAPIIARACRDAPATDPASLMPAVLRALAAALPSPPESVRWRLTPYYSLEMTVSEPERVVIRQTFDFSAAHRLHAPSLSDEANRAAFGRCNNPAGHGHNYRLEPAVAVRTDRPAGFTLDDLERITEEAVLRRFDHTHLNLDTPEFADEGGIIPSVENIARTAFGLLAPAIAHAAGGAAELRSVTVWETDRTSATYPG